jgi:hypothetical protein
VSSEDTLQGVPAPFAEQHLCSVELLDGDLYVLTVHSSTREAGDKYLLICEWTLKRQQSTQQDTYILVDASRHVLPLTQIMKGTAALLAKYPLPGKQYSAIVIDNAVSAMLGAFLRLLRLPLRFQTFANKAEALAWLTGLYKAGHPDQG